MVSDFRRALVGAAALIGLAQSSSGSGWSGLRAGQYYLYGDGSSVDAAHDTRLGLGGDEWGGVRSLQNATDPLCSLPEEDPCTLNTTAIGMLGEGTSTYYDDTCESGTRGCFTAGVRECRTCYLSPETYMNKTGDNETSRPEWTMCPCCVPTTLEIGHNDTEVRAFNFSELNISASDCITPTPTPLVSSIAPTAVGGAPAATDTPPLAPTAEPTAGSGAVETPVPSVAGSTPFPSPGASSDRAGPVAGTVDVDASDTDDGLSMGAKVGIGAAAAVGVIFLGIVGFGAIKASRRG